MHEEPVPRGRLLVAVALAAGPLVSLGLARFAYALLLPEMQTELGWTYARAGVLNTANAVGYLVGALVGAAVSARFGTRRTFLVGTAITALALGATALAGGYAALLTARLVSGVAGAWAFVLGAALVAAASGRASPARAATLLGVYYAGAGVGMTAAGLLVPLVLDRTGPDGWRWGWASLAALGLTATLVVGLALRHVEDPPPRTTEHRSWRRRTIGWLTASYTFFGLGYIAYLTFVVAYLTELGQTGPRIALFWSVLGAAACLGGLAWAPVIGRLGGSRAMTAVLGTLALGTLLPLWAPHLWAFLLSAVLVGGSLLSVVTAMTLGVRHLLPPPLWTAGLGFTTVAFGLGQALGPWLTGEVSDRAGSLAHGLAVSAGLLVVGALLSLLQRRNPAP